MMKTVTNFFKFIQTLAVIIILMTTSATGATDEMIQPLFNETELKKFIIYWPAFEIWNRQQDWQASDIKNRDNRWISGQFTITTDDIIIWKGMKNLPEVQIFLSDLGWNADRFFYLIGHVVKGRTEIKVNKESPKRAAQVRKQLEKQASNTDLSPAARKAIHESLDSTVNSIEKTKVDLQIPESEMDLIIAYKKQLDKTLWAFH